MKALFINTVCGIGSTGRICVELAQKLEEEGMEVKIAYSSRYNIPKNSQKYAVPIGSKLDVYWHGIQSRLLDNHGFASKLATRKFLQWAQDYDPDILWLHNIHGYYINIEMLFSWIKSRPKMKVKWTLHDCWPFTGHCTHFDMAQCNKWKESCGCCAQKKAYPASLVLDRSAENLRMKRRLFTGIHDLTIITPSQWLADLVKQSFLGEYPVQVCNNTINTEVFRPTQGDFRKQYGLEDKKIVLGVASNWGPRKGYSDFIRLAGMLGPQYAVVMVGVSKKQGKKLPQNIIAIQRTDSPQRLAQIYTTADVFFNPTYEDNYPTVNLEAEACGTPVVAYDAGGTKETLFMPESTLVKKGDLSQAIKAIARKCGEK